MKSYYKLALRKYYIACTILGVTLIALWITYYSFINNNLGAILFLFVELIINKFLVVIIANKSLCPILFDNLDAFEFQKIINHKNFIPPLNYRINAAIAIGDHQTLVNIATNQIRKKKCSPKVKHLCFCILENTYFELRDFEKIKIILARHQKYQEQYPSKFRVSNSFVRYYQYFLEQNYEACKTICLERNFELNPKAWDARIRKLQNDFYYAVACYENGEMETARSSFENIVDYAPKMNVANISKKYIEAIESNQSISILENEILPDNNYQLYDKRSNSRIKRYKTIMVIGLVVLAILSAFRYHQMHEKTKEYEKDLNNALSRHYVQAEFIKYSDVKYNKQYLDALCIVKTKQGLDLVSIVTHDKGKTSDIIILVKNIRTAESYCIKSAVSDYYFGFQLYDKKIRNDDFYCVIEFTYENTKYWLGIDYIEKTPS